MASFNPIDRSKAAGALAQLNTSIAAKLLHSPDRRARWLALATLSKGVGVNVLLLDAVALLLDGAFLRLEP